MRRYFWVIFGCDIASLISSHSCQNGQLQRPPRWSAVGASLLMLRMPDSLTISELGTTSRRRCGNSTCFQSGQASTANSEWWSTQSFKTLHPDACASKSRQLPICRNAGTYDDVLRADCFTCHPHVYDLDHVPSLRRFKINMGLHLRRLSQQAIENPFLSSAHHLQIDSEFWKFPASVQLVRGDALQKVLYLELYYDGDDQCLE